jgi:hypothetical protein
VFQGADAHLVRVGNAVIILVAQRLRFAGRGGRVCRAVVNCGSGGRQI